MSKARSGLFPTSTANAKILRATTYKAVHTMIDNYKGSKKPSMAIGAYDVKTGKIATAFAGKIPEKIHPELLNRAEMIGGVGTKGLSTKNTIGVCAEFQTVNKMLWSGSKLADIKLTKPIRPRTGKEMPFCANCAKMFKDLID